VALALRKHGGILCLRFVPLRMTRLFLRSLPGIIALYFVAMSRAQPVRADIADDVERFQTQLEEVLLDSLGAQLGPQDWTAMEQANSGLANDLRSPDGKALWSRATTELEQPEPNDATRVAQLCGTWNAELQHVIALEMIYAHRSGNVADAQAWRAMIALPKHGSAIEGALALQRLGTNKSETDAVSELLAREYLSWQVTRVREKLDALKRVAVAGRASVELVATRLAEISQLSQFPAQLQAIARVTSASSQPTIDTTALLQVAAASDWNSFAEKYGEWRNAQETGLPNLLTPEEVQRRGRLLVKLVRLVPKEYRNGVREGQVVVPLEYREAKDFIVQSQQLVNELSGAWHQANRAAYDQGGPALTEKLEQTEQQIVNKADPAKVERSANELLKILATGFGLTSERLGSGAGAIEEVTLDVRTALKNSLGAAKNGQWAQAEQFRIEAYTTFDTEMEVRVLPRDPEFGLRTERSFLDGQEQEPGIKLVLDQRRRGPELEAAYQRTLDAVEKSKALLKVNLSTPTVIYTVLAISAREGLEAVVVLAALLAGMRGAENKRTRRFVVTGAWVALGATGLTFWLSRTLIQSLSRFGEKLEAVISVLAVIVLLMVTNWVFHKVYWVGWNAKLRKLSKGAQSGSESQLEWLSLVTVGFLTIYREGFETTLFLQSLILESGMKWVLVGIACGAVMVAAAGLLIFVIGARLPYRKLLVFTGVLVVTILVTFLGSTVRLFQTVGWLPIHPLLSLHLPTWAGFWLGLYPSVEGLVIPMLGFVYVGVAWLFVKVQSFRRGVRQMTEARETESFAAHPALAKRAPTSCR
jgi:high-affinity iron transporter